MPETAPGVDDDPLPPWPGPLTADSTWRDVADAQDHFMAERAQRIRNKKPFPTQGDQK